MCRPSLARGGVRGAHHTAGFARLSPPRTKFGIVGPWDVVRPRAPHEPTVTVVTGTMYGTGLRISIPFERKLVLN